MSLPRPLRILLVAVVLGAVAVTAGTWIYIHVLRDEAPDRLALDAGASEAASTSTTAAAAAPNPAAASSGVDGTWKVGSPSQAGYRVNEVLFGQSAAAVGRTSDVTGTITIAGTSVSAGSFSVDMTTVASDESRRDGQFRGRIMNVSQYPTSTFVLTSPIQMGSLPADGAQVDVKATGKLTLHGTTKTVTFPLQAKRTGSTIVVAGTIPITFADYGISNPSGGPAQTEDHGELEFRLTFTR
jgi:polyisoprenoid-binding protein YceI